MNRLPELGKLVVRVDETMRDIHKTANDALRSLNNKEETMRLLNKIKDLTKS